MWFSCLREGGAAPAGEKGRGPSVGVSHGRQANWIDYAPTRGNTNQLIVRESIPFDHALSRGNTSQLTVRASKLLDHAPAMWQHKSSQLTVRAIKLLDLKKNGTINFTSYNFPDLLEKLMFKTSLCLVIHPAGLYAFSSRKYIKKFHRAFVRQFY